MLPCRISQEQHRAIRRVPGPTRGCASRGGSLLPTHRSACRGDRAGDTVRSWKVHVWRAALRSSDHFHVSAEIGFEWNPADAARAYTCEEDLLTELIGKRKRPTRTERRWTRIDLSLHASLPYGSTTPMPEPHV